MNSMKIHSRVRWPRRRVSNALRLLALIPFLLAGRTLALQTIYVNNHLPAGTGNGASWQTAFSSLHAALAAAQAGDNIWIAAGTYFPVDGQIPPGSLDPKQAYFQAKSFVTIYGGFAGNETSFSQRNISQNEVVLSGDIGVIGNPADNSNNIMGGADNAYIDGLTFLKAQGTALQLPTGTDLMNIVNCTFKENGGGAINGRGSAINVLQSIFEKNSAQSGGAIALWDPNIYPTTIISCIFRENTAVVGGGAIFGQTITIKVINCLFVSNTTTNGGSGGAIFSRNNESNPWTIVSNTFANNAATGITSSGGTARGGAVYIYGSLPLGLRNCILWNNTSPLGSEFYQEAEGSYAIAFANNIIKGGLVGPFVVIANGSASDQGGNLLTDPLFMGTGDYRISANSPAVDAGLYNSAIPYPGPYGSPRDLADRPRVRGATGLMDIGAYEAGYGTTFTLYGSVLDGTLGIENAWVTVTAGTQEFSVLTDASGSYQVNDIPVASSATNYTVRAGRACYGTATTTIPGNLEFDQVRDFHLTQAIDFAILPSNPTTGRPVTFFPTSDCADITGYSWSLDVNNPPSPISTLMSPSHVYSVAGAKTVRLTVTRANSLPSLTVTKTFSVSVCPLSGPTFTLLKLGPVGNTCAGGLSQEPIGYSVRVIQDACMDAAIGSVTWRNNNTVQPGSSLDNVVNLNLGKNSVTASVGYTFNGQSFSRSLGPISDKLTQSCGMDQFDNPFIYPKELIVEEKREITGKPVTYRQVEGNVITDEDDDGVKVRLTAHLIPSCPCRFQITFVKVNHKSEAGEFNYTVSPQDDIILPRGRHLFDLQFTIRDIVTGTVTSDNEKREIYVLPPDPELVHTRFSCGTPASVDEAFWRQRIASEELDFSVPDHSIKASGQDFSGILDDGRIKRDLVSGDFQVQAAVAYRLNMNAGLMIRESESAWSPMVFFGFDNTGLFIANRTEYRKPSLRTDIAGRGSQTCLRITRTAGTLEFFSRLPVIDPANSARLLCPDAGWNRVEVPAGTPVQVSGWPNLARVGIASAGSPSDEARFTDVRIAGQLSGSVRTWVNALTQPQTIYNTSFSDGNLVSNWSFESDQSWIGPFYSTPAIGIFSIEKGTSALPAYEGRFFARFTDKAVLNSMATPRLPVYFENDGKSTSEVRFSAMVRTTVPGIVPFVNYLYDNGASGVVAAGGAYPVGTDWSRYEVTLTPPSDAVGFRLILIDPQKTFSGTVDLDNLTLTPIFGGEKNTAFTTATFADGVDRPFQTIRYSADEDVVKASILDGQGRYQRDLPPYAINKALDPTGFRKAKADPFKQFELYHAQDDETGGSGSKDAIDVKPTLEEFREGFGTIFFERSPLARINSVLGPLASYDKLQEYANDIPAANTNPEAVGDRFIRKLHTYLGSTETFPRTREENMDAFGGLRELVLKGKPLDPSGTCEGQSASTNLNCKDRIAKNDLDILDRVWKAMPPSAVSAIGRDPDFSQFKVYNTMSKAISFEQKAGSGKFESMYGTMGEIRFMRDANNIAAKKFVSYAHDPFGRLITVSMVSDPDGVLWDQINADDPEWPGENLPRVQLLIQNFYDEAPSLLPDGLDASAMHNLQGNLSASFVYTAQGSVSKYFSYNEDGDRETDWLKILNLPLQRMDTHFNAAKLVTRTEFVGKSPRSLPISQLQTQTYDDLLRPEATFGSSQNAPLKPIVRHSYWPDGKVRYSRLGQNLAQGITYAYDPAARLIQQRHEKLEAATGAFAASGKYEQKLQWNSQNNIGMQSIYLGDAPEKYRGFLYSYDHFGNLLKSNYGKSTTGWSDDETNVFFQPSQLDEGMSYDEDNVLSSLGRGGNTPIPYHYYGNSYRLERLGDGTQVVAPSQRVRTSSRNFVYDPNGNMILDRSAKRRFEYDFRNLVTKVVQCTALNGEECNGVTSVSEFIYDNEGKRVAKTGRK